MVYFSFSGGTIIKPISILLKILPIDISQVGYTSNEEDYDPNSVKYPFGYGLDYAN